MFLALAGAVTFLNHLSAGAQTSQLVQEGGPLYPVACEGCATPGAVALAWLTDWRRLLLWVLVASASYAAVVAVDRSRSAD